MSVIRAFIAIELTPEIIQRLDQVAAQIKQRLPGSPVRWVPAQNIHITLKFLGDVSLANLDMVKRMLRAETARHASFEISVGELGAFPTLSRPRVIWVGVKAPQDLYALQHNIESESAHLGYAPEERDFSPHLTLGRVSRNASSQDARQISAALSAVKVGFLGAARIHSVHLFKSDLQPGGAVYTPLFSAPLKEPAHSG